MRDVDMMAATMRRIQGSGGGFAHRLQACPRAFVWLAGSAALNGQAVSDLIAGRLAVQPRGNRPRTYRREAAIRRRDRHDATETTDG